MAGTVGYRLLGVAFAVPISFAVKKTLDAAWRRSRGAEPPRDPKAPDTTVTDAVTWAAVSAVAMTAGQLVASRGATVVYRALTGRSPDDRPVKGAKAGRAEQAAKAGRTGKTGKGGARRAKERVQAR